MTIDVTLEVDLGSLHLDVAFGVGAGEVVALLGPNGAGKSTVLRCLAGLQAIDGGRVAVDGRVLDEPDAAVFVPAERRPVSMMFQDDLLFPHLDLTDNVAFGLRCRGMGRRPARAAARDWLSRVGLDGLGDARPTAISGGQAQRVALARALATEPQVLLLDEPLSALDAGTRATVRRDLHRHLQAFDGATVLVTHDALDALALADRVIILEAGAITQEGPIGEVTARPRSAYVADLIGVNLLRGDGRGASVVLAGGHGEVTVADACQGPTLVLIHPHSVALHRHRPEGSPRNQWLGTVSGFDLLGDRVRVRMVGAVPLVAEVTPAAVRALGLVEGAEVWSTVKATDVTTYAE